MKKYFLSFVSCLFIGVIGVASAQAAVTVQDASNVVGSGTNAWSYLVMEGESYVSEANDAPGVGFTKVYANGAITSSLGNPVLGTNTTASKKGALFTQTPFGQHIDKVTYQVQFATPGTYYLYMRFTMFDNAGGNGNYLSEDSFFLPPGFDKDPQTDWPLTDPANGRNGGYCEGCCASAGFLYIPEVGGGGSRVSHTSDTNEWEGIFHWNDLLSSQFLTSGVSGEPGTRFKYEVTPSMVGHPLNFTISYREGGVTVDLFLFSTHPDLMDTYTQAELDQLLLNPSVVTVQDPKSVVGSGTNAWSYLVMEGESYVSEQNDTPGVGFTKVYADGAITNSLGNPVLGTDTTASMKGALFTQTPFGQHIDKVTYRVQFATPGTYYLYMRFTMFDNAGGNGNYLSEDSFFLPPGFDKDPQTDWPLTDPANGRNGGYTEGCCASAGFLYIPEVGGGGSRVSHTSDTNEWEGIFHWNDLLSSQFLTSGVSGEPGTRFKYEVTPSMVGHPLNFTISYREGGVTVDLFLFSTHPDLMDTYTQAELDKILLNPPGTVTVQNPNDVVGTGTNAWSFLVMEGESYISEKDATPGVGFTKVYADGAITSSLGNPVLGTNTTASKQGALFTQTPFSLHVDKVTYRVQFARAGTYYLYMRFTMFDNAGGNGNYLSEDSFFLPPDFDKDPQTDWPLTGPNGSNGGYTEGCCASAGFLYIPEVGGGGSRVSHTSDTNEWEGIFHWNDLLSSQFLTSGVSGEPGTRFKYEVTPSIVGRPLDFTISYREGGVTVDLFLFSTHPDLMDKYTQAELDALLVQRVGQAPEFPTLTVSHTGTSVVLSWPVSATGFVLESAGTLPTTTWTLVTTPAIVVSGDQNTVTVAAASGTRFYRLRKP